MAPSLDDGQTYSRLARIEPFNPTFHLSDVERMLSKVRDSRIPDRDLQPGPSPQTTKDFQKLDSWNRGPPIAWMKNMMHRWANEWSYDRFLEWVQRWPRFKAHFGDQSIHFIHAQAPQPSKLAIVCMAGWPCHPYEFDEMIPLLHRQGLAVVCPSYPGNAFSTPGTKAGWKYEVFADEVHQIMIGLGYDEYVIHGSDWGHYTARRMAHKYSKSIRAIHLSFLPADPFPQVNGKKLTVDDLNQHEKAVIERGNWWKQRHLPYFLMLINNSQLVGLAIHDNPMGILAWTGEKWYICADHLTSSPDTRTRSEDCCLDWMSLMFLTQTAMTSQLPYISAESGNGIAANDPKLYIKVPTGYTSFRYEVMGTTQAGAKASANIVYYKEQPHGGHWSGERPVEQVEDIISTLRAAKVM